MKTMLCNNTKRVAEYGPLKALIINRILIQYLHTLQTSQIQALHFAIFKVPMCTTRDLVC